jgi:hypothetical protein
MRLIIMGCEYTGKTTLATNISKWMIEAMGLPLVRWHNHFVPPKSDQHMVVYGASEGDRTAPGKTASDLFSETEEEQMLYLSPLLLEQFQRHMIWRHIHPNMYRTEEDCLIIDGHYADAVYAPLYFGYGEPGSFADRRQRARVWDAELMGMAPDTVLVLMTASVEVVRQRMEDNPRPRSVLQPQDAEQVLKGFQEEYDSSLILRRFTLDTARSSEHETFRAFLLKMWPHLSQTDRLRLATPAPIPNLVVPTADS